MYTKNQKFFTYLICAAFIVITFFSVLCIIRLSDHDCTHEDCPVCACISQAEHTLKQLGTGSAAVIVINSALVSLTLAFFAAFFFAASTSLVSQKIRLND